METFQAGPFPIAGVHKEAGFLELPCLQRRAFNVFLKGLP